MKEKKQIKAILDTEIADLLRHTEQYEQFLKEEILCENCGKPITIENIGIVVPYKKYDKIQLSFYCNDIICIQKYYESK